MTTTNIIVRTSFIALHHWPGCDIPEVAYLKNPHRHVFGVVAKKRVSHHDRDIEFIQLKKRIDEWLAQWKGDISARSCEVMASKLLNQFGLCYCEVNEDGENGAEVFV